MFGQPDIKRIVKTFDNPEKCRLHENRFLLKTKARKNPKLLNRSNPNCYGISQFKPTKPPSNISRVGLTERLVTETGNILGIKNDFGKIPNNKRFWVSYKNIMTLAFIDRSEREYFLSINKDWSSGNFRINTKESLEKLSKTTKGIPKPSRSIQHRENLRKANLGVPKPNSGPKNMHWYNDGTNSYLRAPDDSMGLSKGRLCKFS